MLIDSTAPLGERSFIIDGDSFEEVIEMWQKALEDCVNKKSGFLKIVDDKKVCTFIPYDVINQCAVSFTKLETND